VSWTLDDASSEDSNDSFEAAPSLSGMVTIANCFSFLHPETISALLAFISSRLRHHQLHQVLIIIYKVQEAI